MAVIGVLIALPLALGACNPAVADSRIIVGAFGSVTQIVVGLPQIVLLCQLHDHGSLSIANCIFQAFGGAIFAVDLVLERASFFNVLPFVLVAVEWGLVLFLVVYYSCQRRA